MDTKNKWVIAKQVAVIFETEKEKLLGYTIVPEFPVCDSQEQCMKLIASEPCFDLSWVVISLDDLFPMYG